MGDLIRRLVGMPTRAESRAIAERERTERAAREIRRACRHACNVCDYLSLVYELTSSTHLQWDAAEDKADHIDACNAGEPTCSACEAHA